MDEKRLKIAGEINWLPWQNEFRTACIENYHHLESLAKVMDELLVS
jgi:hypothetical protein